MSPIPCLPARIATALERPIASFEGRDPPQAGTKLVTLKAVSDFVPGVRIKTGGTREVTLPARRRFVIVEIAVWLHSKYPTNPAENKFIIFSINEFAGLSP